MPGKDDAYTVKSRASRPNRTKAARMPGRVGDGSVTTVVDATEGSSGSGPAVLLGTTTEGRRPPPARRLARTGRAEPGPPPGRPQRTSTQSTSGEAGRP